MNKKITLALTTLWASLMASCSASPTGTQEIRINNECVILLHGLARRSTSLKKIAGALEKQGYHVINIDYPSRKHRIETLAHTYVADAVKQCNEREANKIHFVTHSMGAILLRQYLASYTPTTLGHTVMLSPPNQGSEVVDRLGKMPGFYALNGPAGQQLGTSTTSLPNRLGPADFPVGIITGNRSINPILSMIIPGNDDGKVSVASAKLDGMSDFLVVPHTHPMIMNSDHVIRQVIRFIQQGAFVKPTRP